MSQVVIGVFKYQDDAESALSDLKDLGYDANEISVVMKDIREAKHMQEKTGVHVAEGAGSGAVTGGAIGGLVGLLVGIGAITIPGIGAILIGGPIAAALGLTGAAATATSGAVTGALAGGLVGGLVGLGVPEEEAKEYEEDIKGGGVLLAVPAYEERIDEVKRIMKHYKARTTRQLDLPSDAGHLE